MDQCGIAANTNVIAAEVSSRIFATAEIDFRMVPQQCLLYVLLVSPCYSGELLDSGRGEVVDPGFGPPGEWHSELGADSDLNHSEARR